MSSLSPRSRRRQERLRMIARARHAVVFMEMKEPERISFALRNYDHLKNCSCRMCGNPRKWYGERTLQERRRTIEDARIALGCSDSE